MTRHFKAKHAFNNKEKSFIFLIIKIIFCCFLHVTLKKSTTYHGYGLQLDTYGIFTRAASSFNLSLFIVVA